ncbi:hypothetical protein V8E55_008281 [Tylopilus felleus]
MRLHLTHALFSLDMPLYWNTFAPLLLFNALFGIGVRTHPLFQVVGRTRNSSDGLICAVPCSLWYQSLHLSVVDCCLAIFYRSYVSSSAHSCNVYTCRSALVCLHQGTGGKPIV